MSTETVAADTATQQIKVNAEELIRAVGNVALFAGTDDTLPMLTCINLRLTDDGLLIEATDRYVAAQQTIPADTVSLFPASADGWVPVLVSAKGAADAVKPLAKILRERGNRYLADKPSIVVSYSEGAGFVTFTLTGHIGPDTSMPAEVPVSLGTEYVRLDQFFTRATGPAEDGQEWAGGWKFAARNLAKLTKVNGGERDSEIRFTFPPGTETKPVLAQIGDDFRAVVMPIRPSKS